ncbi:hypothetical protein CkaCkLH20_11689 [Colletotrichum karsti]|uniref:Uncharacterized protein n=1 Tax=Colletotrichum karsti TaxID=1095194 RepID=A0A9P6I2L9_9PEZI|nr:uncharacterized protein CkaCkLH20_11689 [Colletotrichum karsti]KAF9870790.1 hypothetical protein CkaCkLH20_11689 [Colletotrichum karsti]
MDPEGNHAFDGEEPSQERDTSAGTFTSHGIPGESLAARGPRDTESETYKNTKSLLSRDDSSRRDNDDDTDLAVPSIGTAVGTSRSLSSDELPKPQTPVRPQHPSSLIRHEVEVLESRWWGLYNALPKMAAEFNYHFTVEQYWARKRFDDGIRGSRHKILTSPHRLLPTTTTHLVRIQASNDPAIESETRICVAGLGQKKEILDFHAYWRRRYNKHWLQYPNKKSTLLKLCYSPVRVQAAALATCEAKVMSDKTLCGSLIVVRSSKSSQRTSTIGGLMKVNGKFFATTTRHLPEDSEQDMEVHNYGAKLQPDSLLIPNDDASETEWQELCESYRLLIVEEDQSKEEGYGEEQDDGDVNRLAHSHIADEDNQDSGPQEAEELDQSQSADTSPGEEGYFSFRIDEDELLVGRDWQLVPIHSGGLLPNEIPEQRDGPAWARSNPFIEHICKDLRKMFKRDPGSPRKTWVISGMGGLKNCVMCPNPSSMISTDGTVQEIWTIGFDHQGLEAGDSGSWVVDPAHAQLLGMVVARSPGIGYVVPFTSVQQDIAKTMGNRRAEIQIDVNQRHIIMVILSVSIPNV